MLLSASKRASRRLVTAIVPNSIGIVMPCTLPFSSSSSPSTPSPASSALSLDPSSLSGLSIMSPPSLDTAGKAFNLPNGFRCLILGAPGSGKGSLARYLSHSFSVPTISSGDLIRAEIKSGSALGKSFASIVDKGELIPDDEIASLLAHRLAQPDAKRGYILDGFPRRLSQAPLLETVLAREEVRLREATKDKRAAAADKDEREKQAEWDAITAGHRAAGSKAFTSKKPDGLWQVMRLLTPEKGRRDPVSIFENLLKMGWRAVKGDDDVEDARAVAEKHVRKVNKADGTTMRSAVDVMGPTLMPNIVLEVRLREDVLVQKALNRLVCDTCGDGYNTAHIVEGPGPNGEKGLFMPAILPKVEGICDNCEGHLIPRRDDTPDVISTRLASYRDDTQPLLSHYASQHITFPVVNPSTGKPEMLRTPLPVIHWDVHRGLWDSVGLVATLADAVGGKVSYSTGALKAAGEAKEEFAEVAKRIRAATKAGPTVSDSSEKSTNA